MTETTDMWEKHMSAEEPSELCWNEVVGVQNVDDLYEISRLEAENLKLDYRIRAVESIRTEYGRLIMTHRELIGADTVLDLIDAALKVDEND